MRNKMVDILTAPMLRERANKNGEPQPNRSERLEKRVNDLENNFLVLQELVLHLRKRMK